MANGDAAAAAGMDVVASTGLVKDGYSEINKSRDYVAMFGGAAGSPIPLSRGGTGAATAAAARAALNVPAWTDVAPPGTANASGIARFSAAGRLQVVSPAAAADVATKGYVDSAVGASGWNGGVVTGNIFLPNATPATSSYVVCYLNGDGRISRGASSRRYKKFIHDAPPLDLSGIRLREFQLRGGDGTRVLGYIAEELAEDPQAARFVVNDAEGQPDAVDYIQLLLAQVAQLAAEVAELRAQVAG